MMIGKFVRIVECIRFIPNYMYIDYSKAFSYRCLRSQATFDVTYILAIVGASAVVSRVLSIR